MSALDTQIGGDHYKGMPIQPMEFSMANGLDACQHTIIKYVTRFREKGGVQDLEKAKHVIDMLIEFEQDAGTEGEEDKSKNLGEFIHQFLHEEKAAPAAETKPNCKEELSREVRKLFPGADIKIVFVTEETGMTDRDEQGA